MIFASRYLVYLVAMLNPYKVSIVSDFKRKMYPRKVYFKI
jgi:hypothetical protein